MEAKKRGRPKGTTGAYKEVHKKMYSFRLSDDELKAVRKVLAKMRNKLVIFLFVLMMFIAPCYALTLNGSVEYTEETARQEAFEGVFQYLTFPNKITYKHTLFQTSIDYNNVIATANFKSRIYGFIPYKTLSVIYKDDPNRKYYYEKISNGYKCVAVDIETKTESYPIKTVKYLANTGKLLSVIYSVSPYEDFVFDANGNMIEHWVKNNAKMSNGNRQIKYFGQ